MSLYVPEVSFKSYPFSPINVKSGGKVSIFQQYIAPGPGPGKYDDNRTEFHSKKKYKNKKGHSHFISDERRFMQDSEFIKNPGPGKYFAEKDPMAINGPKPKFDSNFGSKSNRKIEEYMVNNPNSPVYNLQEYNAMGAKKVSLPAYLLDDDLCSQQLHNYAQKGSSFHDFISKVQGRCYSY